MRRIKQGDTTGCGLACIAILAGHSYQTVKKKAIEKLNFTNNGEFYTTTRHLKALGLIFNVTIIGHRRRKFKGWDELPDMAIVSINPNHKNTSWHWVVFCKSHDASFVFDPKKSTKSNKRTDFGRMNPSGYLPIQLCI